MSCDSTVLRLRKKQLVGGVSKKNLRITEKRKDPEY